MRNRLTALEIAEADHPGILLAAKQALDHGKSSLFVANLLNQKFSLSLTKSTVEKYRIKRWQVQRDALTQQKQDFHELASEVKDGDLNEAAKALLFQSVRQLHPQTLLGIMRINVQRENLRLKKKALRKLEKAETARPDLTPEEHGRLALNATNALRQVFGLAEYHTEDAYPKGRYLILDAQGKGQMPVADSNDNLSPQLLECAHAQLLRPEGWHGHIYEGPDKDRAIARLKDLYAFAHIPWPTDELPTLQSTDPRH